MTRLRKVRRYRGTRFHGWGQVKGHRGSGQKGGHGQAGLMKHKWSYTVKYDPDHFGKPSLSPQSRGVRKWINVGQLDSLSTTLTLPTKSDSKSSPVLDLKSMGYEKLLGQGKVSTSYRVIIDVFSSRANEKVEKAGGIIVRETPTG